MASGSVNFRRMLTVVGVIDVCGLSSLSRYLLTVIPAKDNAYEGQAFMFQNTTSTEDFEEFTTGLEIPIVCAVIRI